MKILLLVLALASGLYGQCGQTTQNPVTHVLDCIGANGQGATNPSASSAGAVTSLTINTSALRVANTQSMLVQCWTGTTTFAPVTITSLNPVTVVSSIVTVVTPNFSSTANVYCTASSNSGTGAPGAAGAAGATGPAGATGAAGQGVPTGGTTSQVLAKTSNSDYATAWVASPVTQAAVSHQVLLSYTSTTGAFTSGQLAFADISGLATVANTGSASDLGTGTLPDARLSSNVVLKTASNTYTAGVKQTLPPNGTSASFNLGTATATPSSLADGDLFWRNDLGAFGQSKSGVIGYHPWVRSSTAVTAGECATWIGSGYEVDSHPCGTGGTSFYQTVISDSTTMTQRTKLNLKSGLGISLTPVDNSGANSSEITITGQAMNINCVDATGSTTAYTCPSPSPAPTAYSSTMLLVFTPQTTNSTTTPTVNVAGLGVKNLRNSAGSNLSASDLTGGTTYFFAYDSVNGIFRQGSSGSGGGGGTASYEALNAAITTSGTAFTHNLGTSTPIVSIMKHSTNEYEVIPWVATSSNVVTVNPAANDTVDIKISTGGIGATGAAGAAGATGPQGPAGGGGTGNVAFLVTNTTLGATTTFTCPSSSAGTVGVFQPSAVLSANVTSSSVTGCTIGSVVAFKITQASSGGPYTFAWPTNFLQTCPVSPVASVESTGTWYYDGTNWTNLTCGSNETASIVRMSAARTDPGTGGCTTPGTGGGCLFPLTGASTLLRYRSPSDVLSAPFKIGADCNPDTGLCPAGVLTSTSGPVADPGGSTAYQFNNAAGALTFTVPAATTGLQRCYRNATGKSGAITLQMAASNTVDLDGANGSSAGTLVSGGALGDSICLVGSATNHWYAYAQKGTWTNN